MAKYSEEFKIKLVTEYLHGNKGYKLLAKKYNMPSHTPLINVLGKCKMDETAALFVNHLPTSNFSSS